MLGDILSVINSSFLGNILEDTQHIKPNTHDSLSNFCLLFDGY